MALTKKEQEFVDMMKSKDVKSALGKDKSEELEELLNGVDISDDDTIESLGKKQQTQLTKVVKYFTKALEATEKSAVEKATADSRKTEDAKIQKFSADNPGMSNSEVVAIMQPLYDTGRSLEECYATACRGLGLDPVTGVEPTGDDRDGADKPKKKKEAKEDKQDIKSSMKSTIPDDPEDDETDKSSQKDDAPVSIENSLAANSAAYIAKHGNPFETKE